MPNAEVCEFIKHHKIITLSESVQRYYNDPCAAVDVDGLRGFGEIENLVKSLIP